MPNNRKIEEKLDKIIERYDKLFPSDAMEVSRQCMNCKKTKSLKNYFKSQNPLMHNRCIGVCRDCIETKVDFTKFGEVQYFLMLMHLPFVEELWEKCLGGNKPISQYMKLVNLSQYARAGPMMISKVQEYGAAYSSDPYKQKLNEMGESEQAALKAKWGYHYDILDCIRLEEYYEDMMEHYEIATRSHRDYLIKIVKNSLEMDKALEAGTISDYKALAKIYDDLMKSANFAESKTKDKKEIEEFNAFGKIFEMVEKKGFVPQYHNEEDYDIVDKTIKNLKTWTKQLVEGEADLEVLMENAAKRVVEQEQKEKEKVQEHYSEYDVSGLEDEN